MFSVIIPLYNKEQSIKNTVQSVLNQTFVDFEIVIVNDGSTDNSLKVVQQINDSRVIIIDQPNGGVSSARNRGIKESNREWLTFLDGDDLWELNHLEEYSNAITTFRGVNWIISGYRTKNSKKELIQLYPKKGILINIFDDLLNGLKIHTSTVCIRRIIFNIYPELYFREGLNNSEDREVWYKMSCIDKSPIYINKVLSLYILDDPNSLTKNTGNTNISYLSMYARIIESQIFKSTNSENKIKLKKYIFKFNKKAIRGYYVQNKSLEIDFKNYLTKKEWFLLSITIRFPVIMKKILIRL